MFYQGINKINTIKVSVIINKYKNFKNFMVPFYGLVSPVSPDHIATTRRQFTFNYQVSRSIW